MGLTLCLSFPTQQLSPQSRRPQSLDPKRDPKIFPGAQGGALWEGGRWIRPDALGMGSWHCPTGRKRGLFGRLRVSLKRWETLSGGDNKNMRSLITVGAVSVDGSVSPCDAGNLWVAGKKRKIPLLPTKTRGQRSPWVTRCGGNLIPDPFPGWFSPSRNTVHPPLWCFWGEKLPQEGSPCFF